MSDIRSVISTKSPFYLSKHRYLELKHFCLQYPEWKDAINNFNWYGKISDGRSTDISDRTGNTAVKVEVIKQKMAMIEQSAIKADSDIYTWIMKSVCYGVSYDYLKADGVPCSREYFYTRYRKFFWILDKVREK